MIISTIMLYPSWFGVLVQWKVDLVIFGYTMTVLEKERTFYQMMTQIVKEEALIPVLVLGFFGIVLPIIKICLFSMWVYGGGTGDKYIRLIKGLSKWTAVDAIVEALFVGMLIKLPNTHAHHGFGYGYFVMYVLLSSLAFICLPGEVSHNEEPPNALHMKVCDQFRNPRVRKATLAFTLVVFLVVLSAGGSVHAMRLLIPKDTVQWNIGHRLLRRDALPPPLRQLSDPALHRIEEAIARLVDLKVDASVSGCIRRLMYGGTGLYTVFGSFLLFLCVFLLPVAYAVINTAYSLAIAELPEEELKSMSDAMNRGEQTTPWPAMTRLRAVLYDLSMLDVCAVAFPLATAMPYEYIKGDVLPGYSYIIIAAILWHLQNVLCRAAQLSVFKDEDIIQLQTLTSPDNGGGPDCSNPQPSPAQSSGAWNAPIYI